MSKVVVSLPQGLVKNSAVGAAISLGSYVALQFLSAFLIHREVLGEGMIYPLVCVAAALAAFLGCGYSVLRGGSGNVLSASAVVLVFLTLTVAVALFTSEVGAISAGLTGVGASMAIGGLLAAVIGSATAKGRGTRREKQRGKRTRK